MLRIKLLDNRQNSLHLQKNVIWQWNLKLLGKVLSLLQTTLFRIRNCSPEVKDERIREIKLLQVRFLNGDSKVAGIRLCVAKLPYRLCCKQKTRGTILKSLISIWINEKCFQVIKNMRSCIRFVARKPTFHNSAYDKTCELSWWSTDHSFINSFIHSYRDLHNTPSRLAAAQNYSRPYQLL